MNKRSVSMLLILAMLVTLLSGLSLTAAAQESIGAPVWEDGEAEETSEDIDIYFVDERKLRNKQKKRNNRHEKIPDSRYCRLGNGIL